MPTDAEWTTLADHLGGEDDAGGKLKSRTNWGDPNIGATNASGFSGLPGGHRGDDDHAFLFLGYYGYWWSASESNAENAWFRYLNYTNAVIIRYYGFGKTEGLSVRCLRD